MYNAARRAVNESTCQAIWTVYLNADENLISLGQFLSETKQFKLKIIILNSVANDFRSWNNIKTRERKQNLNTVHIQIG